MSYDDSTAREHTRPLRDYRGEAERSGPILHLGPLAPWQATVTVTALDLRGIGRRFQVVAKWHGPPLPGSPPASRPVWATDTLVADELELARALAHAAGEDLSAGRVPDLRGAARGFRERATAAK